MKRPTVSEAVVGHGDLQPVALLGHGLLLPHTAIVPTATSCPPPSYFLFGLPSLSKIGRGPFATGTKLSYGALTWWRFLPGHLARSDGRARGPGAA